MALEPTFAELVIKWHQLHEAFQALRVTTVEDQPLSGDVLLVERCADAAEDLFGWTTEGLTAAVESQDAVGATLDLNRARRALATSQERSSRLTDEFLEFTSFERLTDLIRLGRKRRGEWLAWVKSVIDAVGRCWHPMRELREALIQCWKELAEHRGTTVSVQTTNIGQQISTATPELKDGDMRNGHT
jgi:hypothetical protein